MSSGQKITSNPCSNKPSLTFSQLAWEKIWRITLNTKVKNKAYECSSLGIMDPSDPYKLLDIYVPEQENEVNETRMDDKDKNRWILDMVSQGVDPSQLSLWHHTHADMQVFWSSTDVSTIGDTQTDLIHWSVVTNTDGKIKVRADIFQPVRFWWDDCEYEVDYPEIILDEWWKEQKAKMTFVEPTVKYRVGNKNHNNNRSYGYGISFGDDFLHHLSGTQEKSSKKTKDAYPYEILSNSKLQDAYDSEAITHKEALSLEKDLLLKEKTEKEIEEILDTMLDSEIQIGVNTMDFGKLLGGNE